jgi:hypothetical protein
MASVLEILPRARVFAGPWVILHAGYKGVDGPRTTAPPNRSHRLISGRNGDDRLPLISGF